MPSSTGSTSRSISTARSDFERRSTAPVALTVALEKGLCGGYVKPKAGNLRHNTGAKGVLLHVGIGKGKAVTVHEVVDGRWSGQAAASFYHVLARDLAKVSPGKHTSSPFWRTTTRLGTSPPKASLPNAQPV